MKDEDPEPPTNLSDAAMLADEALVQKLLAKGADIESTGRMSRKAIHYAAIDGKAEVLAALIRAGASLDDFDQAGRTPLHYASDHTRLECARLLLEAGAEVDLRDKKYGNTALMMAVASCRGDGKMIRLLRSHGADPYIENNYGATPLSSARGTANFDIAQHFADLD